MFVLLNKPVTNIKLVMSTMPQCLHESYLAAMVQNLQECGTNGKVPHASHSPSSLGARVDPPPTQVEAVPDATDP